MQGRIDIRVMQQDQQHRNASNGVELGNLLHLEESSRKVAVRTQPPHLDKKTPFCDLYH
jgi:hypothetical protein